MNRWLFFNETILSCLMVWFIADVDCSSTVQDHQLLPPPPPTKIPRGSVVPRKDPDELQQSGRQPVGGIPPPPQTKSEDEMVSGTLSNPSLGERLRQALGTVDNDAIPPAPPSQKGMPLPINENKDKRPLPPPPVKGNGLDVTITDSKQEEHLPPADSLPERPPPPRFLSDPLKEDQRHADTFSRQQREHPLPPRQPPMMSAPRQNEEKEQHKQTQDLAHGEQSRSHAPDTVARHEPDSVQEQDQRKGQSMRRSPQNHQQPQMRENPPCFASSTSSTQNAAIGVFAQRQRYQGQTGPIPQRRQQPRQPQGRKPTPPRWKAIWNRVERGLDDLANFEEMVADGAKRMIHASTSTVTRKTVSRPTVPKQQPVQSSRPSVENRSNVQQKSTKEEPNAKNWADLMSSKKRVIHANGGASSPQQSFGNVTRIGINVQQQPDSNAEKRPPPYSDLGQGDTTATTQSETRRPVPEWRPSTYAAPQTPSGQREETKQRQTRPLQHSASTITPDSNFPSRPYPSELNIDDDDDSPGRLTKILGAVTSPLAALSTPWRMLKRRSSSSFAYSDAWEDKEAVDKAGKKKKWKLFRGRKSDSGNNDLSLTVASTGTRSHRRGSGRSDKLQSLTPPLNDLMGRYANGKDACLLSVSDKRACRSIGRSRAAMDVLFLCFILIGVHEAMPFLSSINIPGSFLDITQFPLPSLLDAALAVFFNSWTPFAFVAAIETLFFSSVYLAPKVHALALSVGARVGDLTLYSQLYLRLVSSLPLHRNLPELCSRVASAQVSEMVEASRLHSFVVFVLALLLVATVSVVRPVAVATVGAVGQMVALPLLKEWPVHWSQLGIELKAILNMLGEQVRSLLGTEAGSALEHPKRLAFQASLVASLLIASRFPNLALRRKAFVSKSDRNEDKENEEEDANLSWVDSSTENLNNIGASGASRLNLQAETGTIEAILERWRMMLPRSEIEVRGPSFKSLLILVGYALSAGAILAIPVALYFLLEFSENAGSGWDPLAIDLSILLFFSWSLVKNALVRVLHAGEAHRTVVSFLTTLSETTEETFQLQKPLHVDMQLAALVSPSKGIAVTDLWAAHTAKRAWAVRGANLQCRSGEVLVLIGDDGAGKTRLLTTLAESIINPPTNARTTTRVRGSIQVGGIDVSKWDRTQLKRRLGLFLNDVRTVADVTELMSGLSLEEILEPIGSTISVNEPRSPGAKEKNAISLALKITGLSTSLLPRLPAKLSTVVTVNEDELKPSALRPRSFSLSPSDWSKVILAKVLAQAIYDNENQAKSGNSPDSCLIGCLTGQILLLDEATVRMSETEESRFLAVLRRTGAATILTSHRCSTGRLANQIAVIKDGAVTESGSHNDLLRAGPQHSMYAQLWFAVAAP